jgi:transcriptional regulator of acetoin/glycerol metabolism
MKVKVLVVDDERGLLEGLQKVLEAEEPVSQEPPPPGPQFFSVTLGEDGRPPPLEEVERSYLVRILEHQGGRRMATAKILGISYPTFLKRLRALGLDQGDVRPRRARSKTPTPRRMAG